MLINHENPYIFYFYKTWQGTEDGSLNLEVLTNMPAWPQGGFNKVCT